jgi:hypothetical protein
MAFLPAAAGAGLAVKRNRGEQIMVKSNKPEQTNAVADAEATLSGFQKQRAALVDKQAVLAEQRRVADYDAHAQGDTKLLDGLAEEAVRLLATSASPGLLDLPRRIMGDVHRRVAARPSERRHSIACKWLTPSDASIFASAASDDVRAAIHSWLRLVNVAGIEGRENLVSVGIGQDAGSIDVFLGT